MLRNRVACARSTLQPCNYSRWRPARNRPTTSSEAASKARCDIDPVPMLSAARPRNFEDQDSPRQSFRVCRFLTSAWHRSGMTRAMTFSREPRQFEYLLAGDQRHVPFIAAIEFAWPCCPAKSGPIEQYHSSNYSLHRRVLLQFQAIDHDDQAQSALHRRADETIARFLGEAGLEAVRTDREGQQRVAIVLANLVPGEFALAIVLIIGIGLDDVPRELRRARGSRCLGSGRPFELPKVDWPADFAPAWSSARRTWNSLPEMPSASAMAASFADWMITPCRIPTATLLWIGMNMLDVREGAPPAPSIGADDEFIGGLEATLLDLVEHHLRCHQLGQTGGGNEIVGPLFEQHAAAVRFDQDGMRGRCLKSAVTRLGPRHWIGGCYGRADRAR